MTEDEARRQRCCGPEGCGTDKSEPPYYQDMGRFCIASDCMAWRRVGRDYAENRTSQDGYCGLAGK